MGTMQSSPVCRGSKQAHRRLLAAANITSGSRDGLVRGNLSVFAARWGLGNGVFTL
jgi:hypothetical protein